MPIKGRTDKENVLCIYIEILFSLQKEGSPVICHKMDEPGGYYVE